MKNIRYIFLISLSIVFSSCLFNSCSGEEEIMETVHNDKENENSPSATPYSVLSLTDSQWNTLLGINELSSKYVREACSCNTDKNSSNFFTARFEVARMLAMLANGANEVTRKEITDLFGFDLENLNSLFEVTTGWLSRADNQVKYNSGSSLWLDNTAHVNYDFMTSLKNFYGVETYSRDLSSWETKEEINNWYADKTEGMISDFLDTPLSSIVSMYIGNAVLFNGKWAIPFDEAETGREAFHSSDGSEELVDMMHLKEVSMLYAELEEGGEAIQMNFGNGIYSILFYLPPTEMQMEKILSFMDHIDMPGFQFEKKVNLSLPRFNISNHNVNINEILSKMGLAGLFDAKVFSELGDLELSSITQEAVINIDEGGAKAAAAIGGKWASYGIIVDKEDVVEMNFNRPFYFCIKAKPNIVLFSGFVNKL